MHPLIIALLAVAGIIVLLLLIAVIRTLAIKAKPVSGEGKAAFTPEEEEHYARTLSEMIKVPTISKGEGEDKSEFHKLHAVLRELFPNIHSKLEMTEIDGNIIYHWQGRDSSLDPILLMGHQDVVPATETDWVHDPFSGDIEGGNIHGRGAMDCKCTVMAEMAAVEELLAEDFVPGRDVYLAYACNEETSGGGAPKLVKYLKDKGIHLCVAMDEGGAIVDKVLPGMTSRCAAVGIVEKGTVHLKFTAKGKGGHSSTPPRNSPFARLSAFVCRIEKKNPFKTVITPPVEIMLSSIAPYLTFPLRLVFGNMWLFKPLLKVLMPKFSPSARALVTTTVVFTMGEGSQAPNVIPGEAYFIANMRVGTQQSRDECVEILRKIAAKYDIETEMIKGFNASKISDPHSEEMAYLKQCVGDVFPGYCFTPYYMCGGTDCRHYAEISDNCLRFTPIYISPEQMAAMHAANESIGSAALAAGVKFYKYFIKNHK